LVEQGTQYFPSGIKLKSASVVFVWVRRTEKEKTCIWSVVLHVTHPDLVLFSEIRIRNPTIYVKWGQAERGLFHMPDDLQSFWVWLDAGLSFPANQAS
jgi:hypothetical protein